MFKQFLICLLFCLQVIYGWNLFGRRENEVDNFVWEGEVVSEGFIEIEKEEAY